MAIFRQCKSWEKGLFNIDNYIEKRSNCKDMMVGIYHLNPSHISKNDQRTMVFEAKMGFNSSSVFLADIILSFVGPTILCPSGQIINFSASVADSFSWNSWWIVHRATHRSTIGRKIVMSAWGIWNIPKCRPTNTDRRPKIDRSSTIFLGDFDKSDSYGLR